MGWRKKLLVPVLAKVAEILAPKYKRLYDTFYHPKFDLNNEIKKHTQLIAEPRQDKEFKSKNFVYE